MAFLKGCSASTWSNRTFWFFATVFIFILSANLAVGEGLVDVTGEQVAIATDMAVNADSIDEAKAEEAPGERRHGCATRSLTKKWPLSMLLWLARWPNFTLSDAAGTRVFAVDASMECGGLTPLCYR